MHNLGSVQERRLNVLRRDVILEWTLDGNIHYVHSGYRVGSYGTIEVDGNVVDATGLSDDFVERYLLESLEDAGFEVRYQTEDESTPSLVRRFVRFISP